MHYRLKDNYALRGWKKLPFALVNLNNGATEFLSREAFATLELHEECRECKYALCCYGGCRADALEIDETDIMGKSMSACTLFKDGWVERIIDAVKSVRPDAKSEVLDNPLWGKTDE